MTLTPGQLAKWSPGHVAQVLGSRAGAYGQATGKAKQSILNAARRSQLARLAAKQAPAASLPHPGYSDPQFQQLVQSDPNLVAIRQAKASGQQGLANAQAWYDQYRQAIETARGQSNAGYGQAVNQTTQQTAGARNLDTQDANNVLAAARADAAKRGQTVDPALAATLSNATASRAAQGGSYASLLAGRGADANTYLAGRGATAVGQKTQYGLNEQQNEQALQRQYGTTKSATALKLSSQLQSAATDAALKQVALGQTATRDATSAAAQKSTAADRAANRALANKKFSSSQAKDAYMRAHNLGPYKPASPKAKGGFTPQQVSAVSNKAIDGINQARQIIKKYSTFTDAQLRQAFANGYYTTQTDVIDPLTLKPTGAKKTSRVPIPKLAADYVNSALDIERLGGLGAVNVGRLHARHVKIGNRLPVGVTRGVRKTNPGGDVQSGGGYVGVK